MLAKITSVWVPLVDGTERLGVLEVVMVGHHLARDFAEAGDSIRDVEKAILIL